MRIVATNPDQTQTVGKKLAALLQPGDLILLAGDLGAGKTTFTKGLALGLGIKRNIKSPTFTLIREYKEGRLPLYHMDVYRLEDGGAEDLGLEEYFNGDGVSVVEWASFIPEELPTEYLEIRLNKDETDDNKRYIDFNAQGKHYEKLVAKLAE
ncbi:tRNA (adenosine(37)-N6)-threonylcarbamoyltransferase complex ATPase subunit type 1 TsaE [Ligilactobacillus agilis]|uniref:tRNA (adenosine(37)-N6)-threonylcarbamoyltransferase complex ATPase subunit type 1 TsaE n=1 Tax=Ligilactobacillus agilis TaxID=1601 RepID=UPI0032081CBF